MSLATPLNPGTVKPESWKRKGSEDESDDSNSRYKKQKFCWYVTLESESPRPTSSDEDESIYSAQANETEFVRDTSDTSTNSWITSGEDAMNDEYEPACLSSNENPFVDCLTSSDPELQISRRIAGYMGTIEAIYDSDVDVSNGSDDTLTSIDSEISHADYWTCVQCNNNNNNPLFRYCEKCYQERKLFLPPRPKGRRRKRLSRKRLTRVQTLEGGELLMSQDSGIGSSAGSQSTISFDLKGTELEKSSASAAQRRNNESEEILSSRDLIDADFTGSRPISVQLSLPGSSRSPAEDQRNASKNEDGGGEANDDNEMKFGSRESRSSVATTIAVSDKTFRSSDSSDDTDVVDQSRISSKNRKTRIKKIEDEHCLICTVGPKNGAFVHGRDSHICCCYRCAMRVWKTTKHCPICNRKVTDVLKAYYA